MEKETWEEEFEDKFGWDLVELYKTTKPFQIDLKSFIRQILASRKEKMLGVISSLPTVTKDYTDETSLYVKVSDIKKKIGEEL